MNNTNHISIKKLPDLTIATIATDRSTLIVNMLKNPKKDTTINSTRFLNANFELSTKNKV